MHFLLVGPGALGCLLASLVSRGIAGTKDRLTLLDYNGDRAANLSRQGIAYHCGDRNETVPVTAVSDPHRLTSVDVILLCVKSYDVAASLDFCRPLLQQKTLVVFLQNGISHLAINEHLGKAAAAFATTTEGATLLRQGHVRHGGSGETFLGFLAPGDETRQHKLENTRRVLIAGGLKVETSKNILAKLWGKLFVNVGINALTATLNCRNGDLLTLPGVEERMRAAVDEAVLVARAEGIDITEDPFQAARRVCGKTAENISSMLQDVRNRRRTEIESINGAIVAKGVKYGIRTPENALLQNQVKEMEAGYSAP